MSQSSLSARDAPVGCKKEVKYVKEAFSSLEERGSASPVPSLVPSRISFLNHRQDVKREVGLQRSCGCSVYDGGCCSQPRAHVWALL